MSNKEILEEVNKEIEKLLQSETNKDVRTGIIKAQYKVLLKLNDLFIIENKK